MVVPRRACASNRLVTSAGQRGRREPAGASFAGLFATRLAASLFDAMRFQVEGRRGGVVPLGHYLAAVFTAGSIVVARRKPPNCDRVDCPAMWAGEVLTRTSFPSLYHRRNMDRRGADCHPVSARSTKNVILDLRDQPQLVRLSEPVAKISPAWRTGCNASRATGCLVNR